MFMSKGRIADQLAVSMDWMPALLAAAGAHPELTHASDEMNLLLHLTQNDAPAI
jgi:hypothetical protein